MINHRISLAEAGVSLGLACAVLLAAPAARAQSRRGNSNGVVIYQDPNFNGKSQSFSGDVSDLRTVDLNDQVSSIQIPNGQQWEVCQDINFQSRCQTLSSSVSDLRTIGWDDSISSLRRVDSGAASNRNGSRNGSNTGYANGAGYGNNGAVGTRGYRNDGSNGRAQQALVFYNRTGYRGTSTVMMSDGYSNVRGLRNGAAGSVQVRSGAWQLCDNTGRCATVTRDVSDLSQLGLRGQITSVRPIDNGRNDGNRRGDSYNNRR
jgi:beta/gamma crystallin